MNDSNRLYRKLSWDKLVLLNRKIGESEGELEYLLDRWISYRAKNRSLIFILSITLFITQIHTNNSSGNWWWFEHRYIYTYKKFTKNINKSKNIFYDFLLTLHLQNCVVLKWTMGGIRQYWLKAIILIDVSLSAVDPLFASLFTCFATVVVVVVGEVLVLYFDSMDVGIYAFLFVVFFY